MNTSPHIDFEQQLLQGRRAPWQLKTWPVTLCVVCITITTFLLVHFIGHVMLGGVIALLGALVASHMLKRHLERNSERSQLLFRESVDQTQRAVAQIARVQDAAIQTKSALRMMRDGVVMLSANNEILVINPAARRLLGLSADDPFRERSFREIVRHPDIIAGVDRARSGQSPQKMMLEIGKGATTRPVKMRIDKVTEDENATLLMTLRDETEAQHIESVRREFIANVSHEIKTPLAAIKGYAETVELAIKDDPDAAFHFMTQIRTQCVRLENLVADMMQLARAQAGPENLRMTIVVLGDVVAKSLESSLPSAESKNIEIVVDDALNAASVFADQEAVLTILNNLLGNAIRYTQEGGRIEIRCRHDATRWILSVADNGVGIAKEEQKRVFERFYRLENARQAFSGGTGIGLSIVKNLTQALGGQVHLFSNPGEGSTFEISLSAASAASKPAKSKD